MSTRLEVIAFDRLLLEQVLTWPIWQVFEEILAQTSDLESVFDFLIENSGHRYVITRKQGAELWQIGSKGPILIRNPRECAELRKTVGTCLSVISSYEVFEMIRGLREVNGAALRHVLIDGYRPWWVGAVLRRADRCWRYVPELEELGLILGPMVGGQDWGFPTAKWQQSWLASDFPVPLSQEVGCQMAVIGDDECLRLAELLKQLLTAPVVYPERVGMESVENTEWGPWVEEVVQSLIVVPRLGLSNLRLVSRLG